MACENLEKYYRIKNTMDKGHYSEAREICYQFLKSNPNDINCLNYLGIMALNEEDYETSKSFFSKAATLSPATIEISNNYGIVFYKQQSYEKALNIFLSNLKNDFKNYTTLYHIGICYLHLKQFKQATIYFEVALENNELDISLYVNLSICYLETQSYHKAIYILNTALSKNLENEYIYNNLGLASKYLNLDMSSIEKFFLKSIRINSLFFDGFNNLGNLYLEYDNINKAEEIFNKCFQLKQDSINHFNLANLFLEKNHIEDALSELNKAHTISPDNPDIIINLSHVYLRTKNFKNGIELLDARWQTKRYNSKNIQYRFPKCISLDSSCKHLYIWPEEGIGDQIFYLGFINSILDKVNKITIKSDSRLIPVFQSSFPSIDFISDDIEDDYTHHLPMLDILKLFYKNPLSMYSKNPFLKINTSEKQFFKDRYINIFGEKLKIGLSWSTTNQYNGKKRSVPFHVIKQLFDIKDIIFINLQYGCHADILTEEIKFYSDETFDTFSNLKCFSAQIASLDGIITIDNSTAHFAGALGIPTILLLPTVSDWRWFRNETHSSWYPSIKIWQKHPFESWESLFKCLLNQELELFFDSLRKP